MEGVNIMIVGFTALTFLLEILIVTVAGVWVVGKINGATEKLHLSIEHLSSVVSDQKIWLLSLEKKVESHGNKLAILVKESEKTQRQIRQEDR